MKMRIIFAITALLLPASLAFSAADGGYAGYYLSQGTGARALGLGKAYVAISGDASCTYWNPAGLADIQSKFEISGMYNMLFESGRYQAACAAMPIGPGVAGVNWAEIFSGGAEKTDASNNITGEFGFSGDAFMLGYGIKLGKALRAGITVVNVMESLDGASASGLGVSAGVQYMLGDSLTLAAAADNIIAPALQRTSVSEAFSQVYRGGFALRAGKALLVSAEADYISSASSIRLHAGVEYTLSMLALRGGYDNGSITAGVGITLSDFTIDYAMLNHELGMGHRFGLTAKFGGPGSGRVREDRKPQEVILKMDRLLRMAVTDLEVNDVSKATSVMVSDQIRETLINGNKFEMVERKSMDKVLKEQQFQLTGCTDTDCIVEMGKILNVDKVIMGTISKVENMYNVSVRVVDIETAKIDFAESIECFNVYDIKKNVKDLTKRIEDAFKYAK